MRPQKINFVKMTGSGNDFVVIDNRNGEVSSLNLTSWVRKVCQRKVSIGADGVLLLEKSQKAAIMMRIFNPDGNEVEMCGNGARCIALFAVRQGAVKSRTFGIETRAGMLEAQVVKNRVKIKLSVPHSLRLNFPLKIKGKIYRVNYINTGVPHVVYFTKRLDNFAVEEVGRAIRYHQEFSPAGTNANFVQVGSGNHLTLRTYERGVEAETLACGTGAVASAIISSRLKGLSSPVSVTTRGGERLKVYFKYNGSIYYDVYLEGQACVVFEGTINIKRRSRECLKDQL